MLQELRLTQYRLQRIPGPLFGSVTNYRRVEFEPKTAYEDRTMYLLKLRYLVRDNGPVCSPETVLTDLQRQRLCCYQDLKASRAYRSS